MRKHKNFRNFTKKNQKFQKKKLFSLQRRQLVKNYFSFFLVYAVKKSLLIVKNFDFLI